MIVPYTFHVIRAKPHQIGFGGTSSAGTARVLYKGDSGEDNPDGPCVTLVKNGIAQSERGRELLRKTN